jgi:hypothetical protein
MEVGIFAMVLQKRIPHPDLEVKTVHPILINLFHGNQWGKERAFSG